MKAQLILLLLLVVCGFSKAEAPAGYQVKKIEGWTVNIQDTLVSQQKEATDSALLLLQKQLQEIVRVVPSEAVARLREVPLWFSPEYPKVGGRAEYHPAAGWLRENGRNPAMAKGVEFTNVLRFSEEMDRMPNFTLHELAHAYHDRVLKFDHPGIKAAYDAAVAAKLYEKVERWHGTGKPTTQERAYGITNEKEYFAEATEAIFVRNDFFPFTRAELKAYDPTMFSVVEKAWTLSK